jgi:biopolymer transport protein ExbD
MRLPPPDNELEGPNMVPMIDVVFLLLIFFLVATRFDQEEREIDTRLAEVSKAQPLSMPPEELIVNINEKGEYLVVKRTLDEEMLSNFLHTLAIDNPGTQTVQIRADERVPFAYPARVMGFCEREKIKHYCTVVEER